MAAERDLNTDGGRRKGVEGGDFRLCCLKHTDAFVITWSNDNMTFPHVSQSASSLRVVTSSWTHRFPMALWGTHWRCLLLASCRPARPSPLKPRAECSPSSCMPSSWKSWPPSPRSTALHWTVLLRSNGSDYQSSHTKRTYLRSCLAATSRWLCASKGPKSTKHAHTLHIEWVVNVNIVIKYCFYAQICMYNMFIFLAELEYFNVFPVWIWMIFIRRWKWFEGDYFEVKYVLCIYLWDRCK